jgi:hypothetical protein
MPLTVILYLYVRVSRELKVQEGPLAVMMYEARTRADRSRTDSCQEFRWAISKESYVSVSKGCNNRPEKSTSSFRSLCCLHAPFNMDKEREEKVQPTDHNKIPVRHYTRIYAHA